MAIRAIRCVLCVLVVCGSAMGAVRHELGKLVADKGARQLSFGWAVDIDGDISIVGVYQDRENGNSAGSVHVYSTADPANPAQVSRLLADDGAEDHLLGYAVAIEGGIVAAGAPGFGTVEGYTGRVYLFDVSNPAAPVQLSKVVASDGAQGDAFGVSVAIDGTILLVGADGDDHDMVDMGSVYVFDISDPAHPVELSKLVADAGSEDGRFGTSVGVFSGKAIVGAIKGAVNPATVGCAYLFDISDPENPVPLDTLFADNGVIGDRFGQSVAIGERSAVVGAPLVGLSGGAYVFDISDPDQPVQASRVVAESPFGSSLFGYSVAIDGDSIVVGAPGDNIVRSQYGGAYVYDIYDPTDPIQIVRLQSSDLEVLDWLGWSVAIDGGRVVAGAIRDLNGRGSAYMFDAMVCAGDTNFDGAVDVTDISGVLKRLGQTGPRGDANGDGVIDVNDISFVLFRLGDVCP